MTSPLNICNSEQCSSSDDGESVDFVIHKTRKDVIVIEDTPTHSGYSNTNDFFYDDGFQCVPEVEKYSFLDIAQNPLEATLPTANSNFGTYTKNCSSFDNVNNSHQDQTKKGKTVGDANSTFCLGTTSNCYLDGDDLQNVPVNEDYQFPVFTPDTDFKTKDESTFHIFDDGYKNEDENRKKASNKYLTVSDAQAPQVVPNLLKKMSAHANETRGVKRKCVEIQRKWLMNVNIRNHFFPMSFLKRMMACLKIGGGKSSCN